MPRKGLNRQENPGKRQFVNSEYAIAKQLVYFIFGQMAINKLYWIYFIVCGDLAILGHQSGESSQNSNRTKHESLLSFDGSFYIGEQSL